MLKCQKCAKPATYHITEIHGEDKYEEIHLCEECYHKHFSESQTLGSSKAMAAGSEEDEEAGQLNQRECSACGLKFVEFRNSGRLGCPHDYDEFKEELSPLLENIHGETKHCGKTPRRHSQNRHTQSELLKLRKQLQQAVTREAYEDAARLRDQIRQIEES